MLHSLSVQFGRLSCCARDLLPPEQLEPVFDLRQRSPFPVRFLITGDVSEAQTSPWKAALCLLHCFHHASVFAFRASLFDL
jgi:hypothetical protein